MQHPLLPGFDAYAPTGTAIDPTGLPFLDFVEDAAAKKGFAAHSYTTLPSGKPGAFQFFEAPLGDWTETVQQVQLQYSIRVGSAYQLKQTSLWILQAALACKGSTPELVEAAKEAHAACGRLVYEGLGLAGYTGEAKAFCDAMPRLAFDGFTLVELAGRKIEERFAVVTAEELKELDLEPGDTTYKGVVAVQRLFKACTGYTLSQDAAWVVRTARRVHVCARQLAEGKGKEALFADEEFLGVTLESFAPIAQMMRHASKGELGHGIDAMVASEAEGLNFDEEGPTALVDLVDERAIRYFFGSNRLVTGMVFRALNIQRGTLNAKRHQAVRDADFFA